MTITTKHPIQPIFEDPHGTLRFKENKIVSFLLESAKIGAKNDLNSLRMMPFSDEDHEQFAQLIGYSISGFGDLSFVSNETYRRVKSKQLRTLSEKK